jgi:hypothetical protein
LEISLPAACVGAASEHWLPTAALENSGSILPIGQLLARARALGKESVADCGDSAATSRRRQPVTAVSALSELECAVSQAGKLAYIEGRVYRMGMEDDLVRSSTKFSGEIDFMRMASPPKAFVFLQYVIASGGSGAVLSSQFV